MRLDALASSNYDQDHPTTRIANWPAAGFSDTRLS